MIKLNIGATVMLRSGGPAMTVWNIREELVETSWFVNNVSVKDAFHFTELVQVVIKDIEYDVQSGI